MAERSISLRQRKIVLLGDSKTGKHCYMSRLINNKYPNDFSSNVSACFMLVFFYFLHKISIYFRKDMTH